MNIKKEVVIGLSIILLLVLIVNFLYGYEPFILHTELTELDLEIPDDNFTRFAVVVIFLYDAMPTIAQQFSISAIGVQLLLTGFSPIILALLSAVGLLTGQMILYGVGMFIKKIHKGSIGNIAGKHHIFMKYHFLVYMMIPFIGILGDAGMLYSGHQRISPLKIIPFLFIADLASTARWIIPTMAELEIGESLQ